MLRHANRNDMMCLSVVDQRMSRMGLRGRWLGSAVESPHYQTSVVRHPTLPLMFIKRNARYKEFSMFLYHGLIAKRVEQRKREYGSSQQVVVHDGGR